MREGRGEGGLMAGVASRGGQGGRAGGLHVQALPASSWSRSPSIISPTHFTLNTLCSHTAHTENTYPHIFLRLDSWRSLTPPRAVPPAARPSSCTSRTCTAVRYARWSSMTWRGLYCRQRPAQGGRRLMGMPPPHHHHPRPLTARQHRVPRSHRRAFDGHSGRCQWQRQRQALPS